MLVWKCPNTMHDDYTISYLGTRLSKEATHFTGKGDSVLVLESPDRVNEHLNIRFC